MSSIPSIYNTVLQAFFLKDTEVETSQYHDSLWQEFITNNSLSSIIPNITSEYIENYILNNPFISQQEKVFLQNVLSPLITDPDIYTQISGYTTEEITASMNNQLGIVSSSTYTNAQKNLILFHLNQIASTTSTVFNENFNKFIHQKYESELNIQQHDISPDEYKKRTIVFSIFDIILVLMNKIRDNVKVLVNQEIFLSRWQDVYTERMLKVPLEAYDTTNTYDYEKEEDGDDIKYRVSRTITDTTVDTTDYSKSTLAYGNLTIRDFINYTIFQQQGRNIGFVFDMKGAGLTDDSDYKDEIKDKAIEIANNKIDSEGYSDGRQKAGYMFSSILWDSSENRFYENAFHTPQMRLMPVPLNAQSAAEITGYTISFTYKKIIAISNPAYKSGLTTETTVKVDDGPYAGTWVPNVPYLPWVENDKFERTVTFPANTNEGAMVNIVGEAFHNFYNQFYSTAVGSGNMVGIDAANRFNIANSIKLPHQYNQYVVDQDGDFDAEEVAQRGESKQNEKRTAENDRRLQLIEDNRSRRELIRNQIDQIRSTHEASQAAIKSSLNILQSALGQLKNILSIVFR